MTKGPGSGNQGPGTKDQGSEVRNQGQGARVKIGNSKDRDWKAEVREQVFWGRSEAEKYEKQS